MHDHLGPKLTLLVAALFLLLGAASVQDASAASEKKTCITQDCKAPKKDCLKKFSDDFKMAKADCKAKKTGDLDSCAGDKQCKKEVKRAFKQCKKEKKLTLKESKAACKTGFKTCKTCCKTVTTGCGIENCGDGIVVGGEECDDGGESATCDANCTNRMCGDNTVNSTAGEQCDDGGESATCDADCTNRICGDNTVNSTAGEQCDDGNQLPGDCCSPGCSFDPQDTACGDPSDTECTNPDTCDGAGNCESNHEPAGTPCGQEGNECDGEGNCVECSCARGTRLGFTTGIAAGQDPAGTLSSHFCSNYVDGACADNGDCDFGTCWDPPGICSGNTSATCSGNGTPCTGTCGEVSSGNLPMNLKVGSLYTGGGLNSVPLPLPVPDQGLAYTNMTAYNGGTGELTLGATTTAEVGKYHCTKGRTCSTTTSQSCVVDSNCPGGETCVDNCIYGPQLPIPNAGTPATSVCVVNAVADDASGTAQCDGGDSDLQIGLRSVIYLTGDLLSSSNLPDVPGVQPCPLCVPICQGGTKDGLPCRPANPHRSCAAGTRVGKACTSNSDCPNPPNPNATCLPARNELLACTDGGGTCPLTSECLGGQNDGTACVPETSTPDLLGDAQDSYPTSHTCTLDSLQNITANIGGLPVDLNMTTGTQEKNAVDRQNGARVFCGFCRDVTGGGSLKFEGDLSGPTATPPATGNAVPCNSDFECQHMCAGGTNASRPCAGDGDCPGSTCVADTDTYESCVQRDPGAFSEAAATRIEVTGDSSGCLGDFSTHAGTLVSIFCVPPTFDATVDAAGDLPGPGAVLLYGEAQLLE